MKTIVLTLLRNWFAISYFAKFSELTPNHDRHYATSLPEARH
jgi:hypothetical protein